MLFWNLVFNRILKVKWLLLIKRFAWDSSGRGGCQDGNILLKPYSPLNLILLPTTPVKAMFCYYNYFKTFYFYLNGQKSRKPHLLPGGRVIFTYLTHQDKVGVLIGKHAYLER